MHETEMHGTYASKRAAASVAAWVEEYSESSSEIKMGSALEKAKERA